MKLSILILCLALGACAPQIYSLTPNSHIKIPEPLSEQIVSNWILATHIPDTPLVSCLFGNKLPDESLMITDVSPLTSSCNEFDSNLIGMLAFLPEISENEAEPLTQPMVDFLAHFLYNKTNLYIVGVVYNATDDFRPKLWCAWRSDNSLRYEAPILRITHWVSHS